MFDWLNDIIQTLLQFFPQRVVVRNTHVMLKWKHGRVIEKKPGCRWYWPLTTDYELVIVANQPMDLTPQTLLTSDGIEVTCGGIVVFEIRDAIKACGEKNYDINGMVDAIAQAAIVEVVTQWKLDDLVADMEGNEEALTKTARTRLRPYGVYVKRTALNSFSTASTYNIMGVSLTPHVE
jgi:hypothetical protein